MNTPTPHHEWLNISNSIPFILFGVDPSGEITLWNAEAQKQTGISSSNAIGKPLASVFPRLAGELETIQEVITSRKTHSKSRRAYQENNRILYEDLLIYPLIADETDGALIQITAASFPDEKQEQLNEIQKMEAIGLMAGGVAHDLNNVLTGVISYPELILMDLPPDHKLVPDIKMIKKSGLKAISIIDDLLAIAKSSDSTKFPTQVNDLIDECFKSDDFKDLAARHPHIKIEKCSMSESAQIACSIAPLSDCILNLISNAVEASQDSGRVIVSTRNITATATKNEQHLPLGDYALLAITDTGPEISATDLKHIFEPFYSKKKLGRSNTGLNLAIVWNCIKDHDGYIRVQSSPKGTIFKLYLPITAPAQPAKTAQQTTKTTTPRGTNETILVIDDEEVQRLIACKILETLNYCPTAVSSGEQAISFIETNPVDLIILDMIMDPGINGLTTYQAIKKSNPHQKAIIASGYAELNIVDEALAMEDTMFLGKPYTIDQLGQAVKKILSPSA